MYNKADEVEEYLEFYKQYFKEVLPPRFTTMTDERDKDNSNRKELSIVKMNGETIRIGYVHRSDDSSVTPVAALAAYDHDLGQDGATRYCFFTASRLLRFYKSDVAMNNRMKVFTPIGDATKVRDYLLEKLKE